MKRSPMARRLHRIVKERLGIRAVNYPPLPTEHDPIKQMKRQAKVKDGNRFDFHLLQLLEESFSYDYDTPGLRSAKDRMRYLLTCYELFKKVVTIPGHIVEVGVYR